jgi:type I restriction-modification system DNA methylase subunit
VVKLAQTTLNHLQNRNLFSNHYLESLIKDSSEWNEDVGQAFVRAKEIYNRRRDSWKNLDESMLEQFLIKPILEEVLEHHYIPQAKVEKGSRRPDYAFFENDAALSEALEHKESDDLYLKAIAVGDAKRWKVLLDKKVKGSSGSFEFQNPSYQIDQYLHMTKVQWGILTNGHHWRIYYNETSYKLDSYYDIDLETILETDDVEGFKYFYLFFRREAFVMGPDGRSFLDNVYDGSVKYAKELGDSLQKNVYEAMKIISEGFFERSENDLVPDEHNLREVQENTLRLLYRLLFIFYAESGKLLNTDNSAYDALSLESIKNKVAGKIDNRELILPVTTDYWNKLETIFALINEGSESKRFGLPKETLYIPAYNGGLFDPDKNPFLHTKKVGDEYLARAIDLMARDDGNFIDYSTLGTRQLGSIYEGLLEYKLKVAEEDLVAIKEKGKEKWIPKKDAEGKKTFDEVLAGSIYLATDKGERKATGSYYTPDYIVKYIVRNTLGPVLEDKRKAWSEKGLGERPFLHDILDIRVLDPAMGSGHFLVEACEFLANKLVEAWGEAKPEDLESDVVAEHDVHWARREVVRHCIYGVDLNSMAVELAKLSLWLETVAVNKPLTFLDHHLKVGNSLIGAEVKSLKSLPSKDKKDDVENGTKRPTLWDFTVKGHFDKLLQKYGEFAAHPDDDLASVKQKEHEYDALQRSELNRRIHELANVWVSTYFGVVPPPDEYADLQNEMNPGSCPDWSRWREREWFRLAQEVAEEKSFFHWELEFPEVFYEKGAQKVNPGWDAVVGNPPYDILIRSERGKQLINYLNNQFRTAQYNPNLFALFMERSLLLVRLNGKVSLIVPNMWLTNEKYSKMRDFLLKNSHIQEIFDFEFTVFNEVIPTCTFLVKRAIQTKDCETIVGVGVQERGQFPSLISKVPQSTLIPMIQEGFENVLSRSPMILDYSISDTLSNHYIVYRGVETRDNKKYLSQSKRNSLDRAILNAPDINRYYTAWSGTYVRFIPKELKSNADVRMYEVPCKVLLRRTGDRLIASIDKEGYLALKNLYVVIPKSNLSGEFLCSLLNSKLLDYERSRRTRDKGQAFAQIKGSEVSALPIRRISLTTPADRRAALVNEAKALCIQYLNSTAEPAPLLDFVGERLGAEPEESDVVHDLLAHLAERMIDMNKEKNAEIKSFRGFLEGETGAAVDDMANKTAVREYYNHEFQKLIDILGKNRKKLKDGYDPKSPTNYRHLQEWYEDSMDKLQPLRGRIEATDGVIDKIVYRLYGLSDEEIKIVEESI